MSYQCGLGTASDCTCNHACSPVNGYRGTYILGTRYPVSGAGLIYTKLANWESLLGAQLMGILGNGIPLRYGSPSISVMSTYVFVY